MSNQDDKWKVVTPSHWVELTKYVDKASVDEIRKLMYGGYYRKQYEQVFVIEELAELPGEHLQMTGTEYIQQRYGDPRARYKHMRGMLQEIWNIQHKHPNARFDIDGNFGYDADKIAHYIQNNASYSEINQAHNIVRDYYRNKGRGRPKGARNINKVMDNTPRIDFDELIEDLGTEQQLNKGLDTLAPKPLVDLQIDGKSQNFSSDELRKLLADYVTLKELDNREYVNVDALKDVARNLETGIKEAFADLEKKISANKPTIVELKRNELPNVELGVQHKQFPTLLKMCTASMRGGNHLNVWVYGPAGTGKTTAARFVAQALNLEFYMLGALETGYQILGYNDANGNYVDTLFRRCWENGGVIALDEIDSYTPSAALALNGALANGHCAFPDKIVARHPNCVVIAGANTTGLGGTIEYVGRLKQDAAFLDRFVMLDWPIDEALEDSLCANKKWIGVVRYVRNKVIQIQMKGVMITPRATLYGESLLSAGLDLQTVLNSTLKKGMTEAQWKQVAPPANWDV